MVEIKQCPVCWGKGAICVGLRDNLEPITKPCSGCAGTGWLACKIVDRDEFESKGYQDATE